MSYDRVIDDLPTIYSQTASNLKVFILEMSVIELGYHPGKPERIMSNEATEQILRTIRDLVVSSTSGLKLL